MNEGLIARLRQWGNSPGSHGYAAAVMAQAADALDAAEAEIARLRNAHDAMTNMFNEQCATADRYGLEANAAEAKLDAIDAYVVQLRQQGGPVCDTIARHLTEFLHPQGGRR